MENNNDLPPARFRSQPYEPEYSEPEDRESEWLLVLPVDKLLVSEDEPIRGSWRVGDVTFYSRERTKKELARLTAYPESTFGELADRSAKLNEAWAFAVFRLPGRLRVIRPACHAKVEKAINVLVAASCTWHGRGDPVATCSYGSMPIAERYSVAFDLGADNLDGNGQSLLIGNEASIAPFQTLMLDKRWHEHLSKLGFLSVLEALVDKSICPDWQRQIGSAAALFGRSLRSVDLVDAVLFNVFALETLLTKKEERNHKKMFGRIKGLLGWHYRRAYPKCAGDVKALFAVRNAIVHDSDPSELNGRLLLTSDSLLENCLLNVTRNLDRFVCKDRMIEMIDDYAKRESWPEDGSPRFTAIGPCSFREEEERELDQRLAYLRPGKNS